MLMTTVYELFLLLVSFLILLPLFSLFCGQLNLLYLISPDSGCVLTR